MEIYNENISDLLAGRDSKNKSLPIREDQSGSVYVADLKEECANCEEKVRLEGGGGTSGVMHGSLLLLFCFIYFIFGDMYSFHWVILWFGVFHFVYFFHLPSCSLYF